MTSPLTNRRTLSWLVLTLAGVMALGAGLYFGAFADRGDFADLRGNDAQALLGVSLPDAKGREQSIGQWKGKVLVVNFWATWCVPCREEMPEFVRAQQEFGARGLQFVGIAIDDAAKVDAFAAELGLNYPALIGGYGAMELSRSLGNRLGALPFTVIIDRAGRVSHTQLGPIKEAQLRAIVSQLL
jgi:thiol-disulfide isomerase/thioredoxin